MTDTSESKALKKINEYIDKYRKAIHDNEQYLKFYRTHDTKLVLETENEVLTDIIKELTDLYFFVQDELQELLKQV